MEGQRPYPRIPSRVTQQPFVGTKPKAATGLHWHETHTEYLQVVSGAAFVTLGDTVAKDGIITIPRFMVHGYSRADSITPPVQGEEDGKDVDLVIKEWTDPQDGGKVVFFRNVLGIILDRDEQTRIWGNLWMLGVCLLCFGGWIIILRW
jgi:hypothetical protein